MALLITIITTEEEVMLMKFNIQIVRFQTETMVIQTDMSWTTIEEIEEN